MSHIMRKYVCEDREIEGDGTGEEEEGRRGGEREIKAFSANSLWIQSPWVAQRSFTVLISV